MKVDATSNQFRTKPLSYRERRKLIEAPFPPINIISGKSHAGIALDKDGRTPHAVDTYPDVTLWRD